MKTIFKLGIQIVIVIVSEFQLGCKSGVFCYIRIPRVVFFVVTSFSVSYKVFEVEKKILVSRSEFIQFQCWSGPICSSWWNNLQMLEMLRAAFQNLIFTSVKMKRETLLYLLTLEILTLINEIHPTVSTSIKTTSYTVNFQQSKSTRTLRYDVNRYTNTEQFFCNQLRPKIE